MLRSTVSFFILLMFTSSSIGQSGEKTNFLEVERGGNFVKYRLVTPMVLNDAFPEWKASAGSRVQIAFSRRRLWESVLRKVELIRLSRYVDYKLPSMTLESGTGSAYSHATFFPAAILDGEIYVFSRQDLAGNARVINRMIEKIGVKVANKDEARQLVELYILFYSGDFNDPSKLIISRIEDIPQDELARQQEQAEKLMPLIHPLRVAALKGHHQVEFFTWEYLPRGEVMRWQVNVFPNGRLEVSNEMIGMV